MRDDRKQWVLGRMIYVGPSYLQLSPVCISPSQDYLCESEFPLRFANFIIFKCIRTLIRLRHAHYGAYDDPHWFLQDQNKN